MRVRPFLKRNEGERCVLCCRLQFVRGILRVLTLGLQIAQNRSYLHTLRPKVGVITYLDPQGFCSAQSQFLCRCPVSSVRILSGTVKLEEDLLRLSLQVP